MTVRNENPNFNSGDICKQIGTTPNVMRRYFSDLKMSSPFRHQQPKHSNKERVKYSYENQTGTYVRDIKNGTHIFNTVSRNFISIESTPLKSTVPLKTRIDQKRNVEAQASTQDSTQVQFPRTGTSSRINKDVNKPNHKSIPRGGDGPQTPD